MRRFLRLGATTTGNCTPEEVQFVTGIIDGAFVTERILSPTEKRGMIGRGGGRGERRKADDGT
jgi:hypothetical protein